MISDPRTRLERMNKDQLVEIAVSQYRDIEADQQHRAALKRDLARALALQATNIRQIDNHLGAPVLHDLISVLADVIEASHPLSSTPAENTMRVTNPSSSKDEGAPTRRYRNLEKAVRRRVENVTETIRHDLERDEWSDHLSFVRRQTALSRWHGDGKHDQRREEDCPDCMLISD